MTSSFEQATNWPLWRKIAFRFLFIYFVFTIAPWTWFDVIEESTFFSKWISLVIDPLVVFFNRILFHVRPALVPINGSGDTSYGWAALWTFLLVAAVGAIIWTLIDRKRQNYNQLNYWMCLFIRYSIALAGLFYGFDKVFLVQMPFPSLHQLATPLGDFSPMRFSWLFIGYASPYQFFSGVLEITVGLLLLNRRTVTLGLLLGVCVFANVMMLNLTYNIVVKIYSMQLVFNCLFLLASDNNRMFNLLVLNRQANPSTLYNFIYTQKWLRISRYVLKTFFILFAVGFVFYLHIGYYKSEQTRTSSHDTIFKSGFYRVTSFSAGSKNEGQSFPDSLRWQDVIFDQGQGSINTADTSFRQRYNRAYFSFKVDSLKHTITFHRVKPDGSKRTIADFNYTLPDTNTITLSGLKGKDSLFVSMKRVPRNFRLAKWRFNWLLEGPE